MIGAGDSWRFANVRTVAWGLAAAALGLAGEWCFTRAKAAAEPECGCFDCQWPTSWTQRVGH